jgi:ribosome assembly protein YihI (activator of Der GTPase)
LSLYLEVETQSISSSERTIVPELAQASRARKRKKRKDGDQSSSIRTRLVEETRFGGL